MSRPAAVRPLHPFVATLWGILLVWSVWVGAVWLFQIGPGWLGYSPEEQITTLKNDDFWRAVEILAAKVELIWLALAAVSLHLFVASTHGLRTARTWLAISAGLGLGFGVVNALTGLPFGWMSFGEPLTVKMADWRGDQSAEMVETRSEAEKSAGTAEPMVTPDTPRTREGDGKLLGVPPGWALLWLVLVIAAREAVLWVRPRASHQLAALAAAGLVALTLLNLEPIASGLRGWWGWHRGDVLQPATFRWWIPRGPWFGWSTPLGWLGCAWVSIFLLREKSVVSAVARRSSRPLILLGIINTLALLVNFRNLLR